MKTHEMARHLEALARALRAAPNMELTAMGEVLQVAEQAHHRQVATNLEQLLAFSRFSKGEWAELIEEYDLPIEVKSSHSARDLVGKVLNTLDRNPDILENIKTKKSHNNKNTSKTLISALKTLLEG